LMSFSSFGGNITKNTIQNAVHISMYFQSGGNFYIKHQDARIEARSLKLGLITRAVSLQSIMQHAFFR
jgi:hypothetical protein